MDHIGASLEIINLICTTLVFIRDVTERFDSTNESSTRLDQFVTFLDAFSEVCYTDVTGLLRDARVHEALCQDVEYCLYSLNKSLAAHREAWRYVIVVSDPEQRRTGNLASSSLEIKYERKRWREGMKERSQVWRESARPGLCGALFGREEMKDLVANCAKIISRLRQTLKIVFLTIGPPHPTFSRTWQASELGVVDILERQRKASLRPSGTYNALPGSLRDSISTTKQADGLTKTVYKNGCDEVDVLVEIRSDKTTPTELLCHLTSLLQMPTLTNLSTKKDKYHLNTLSCMGFIDDPINNRGLILYRSPKSHPWASTPPSLHALIRQGAAAKLTLSGRFNTARMLASSLLETHSSGWFHRNLTSRSVIMLPQTLNDLEPSPHLVGWGVPLHPDTKTFRLEPNLYQHQDRFGKPFCEYQNAHDIYSLGVVLLELGLWRTMSTIFAKRIEKTPHFAANQQQTIFWAVNQLLVERASGIELRKEMGESYAEVVLACLTWSVREPIEGMLEFRKLVVDPLIAGGRM